MATVKMVRGSLYADIFDSEETIAQAKKDGFELVDEKSETPADVTTEETPADVTTNEEKYVTDKELLELTVAQLKELGKSYGIKVYNLNNKTDLIKALSAVKVTVESFESLKA